MKWSDFQRAAYERLRQRLNDHLRALVNADDFLKRYGFPPYDPIRLQLAVAIASTRDLLAAVIQAIRKLPTPYRPLVSPWRSQGLSAHLKPDFKARGIKDERP